MCVCVCVCVCVIVWRCVCILRGEGYIHGIEEGMEKVGKTKYK